MLGVQDFIGYYDWTFEYLRRNYGEPAVKAYWGKCIAFDSQRHARQLFLEKGFDGMYEYWAYTLDMEEAGYTFDRSAAHFRIDMFNCPSKGHLIKRDLEAYHDYCAHCMGWIKPLMAEAGFLVNHEHNHAGQCWWEMRRAEDRLAHPPPLRGPDDARHLPHWEHKTHHLYLNSKMVDKETQDAD